MSDDSIIDINASMNVGEDRITMAPSLSIEVLQIDGPVNNAPPPNTPALKEHEHESTAPARRFLIFKPREFLPALNICTGLFLPDDQPVMAAPPNSPITSRCAKFEEEDEMALLPWAIQLKAGGLEVDEEAIPADYAGHSSVPSRSLSPTTIDSSDDGSFDCTEPSENVIIFERPTSTRVIVRPLFQRRASGFFGRLSRSSTTPSTRPGTPSSTRPSSPSGFAFGGLNCFSHSDAFEREVDYLAEQGASEMSGASQVQVHVTRETSIQREELWREAIQQVLYGQSTSPHAHGNSRVIGPSSIDLSRCDV
ncbi:hypothetical protein CCMSSC00406_0009410 [Pleurotus cornucopiae]|uniref:Uncharacterized protein n=1 Tax=Pleurotus cornucopiae TaxID=5321 RepID=A0ACB7IUA4_PLECO|nr:hypothetical protein CCMSSC00406_0009410 [Pleurotus cornucopiae]